MKAKASIITLIFFTFFIAISLTNISSALVSSDYSPESYRLWVFKTWLIIVLTIFIAYGAVLPVVIFFWIRKNGYEKLRILLKIDLSEKGAKHGITALVIGIIAICSFWWHIIPIAKLIGPGYLGLFFFGFPFIFSLFAVIFCSFNKFGNKFIDLGSKLSLMAFLFNIITFSGIIALYV